jgi:hypothetical protein
MTPNDDLDRAVRRLPRSIEPPPEVWAGIERRIRGAQHRRWAIPVALAVAAAAVLAVVLVPTREAQTLHPTIARLPDLPQPEPHSPPPVDLIPAESELRAANKDLTDAYNDQRRLLDESLLAVLDENIGVVDEAIDRSRAALVQRPDDEHLRGMLDRAYRHKLALLRRAVGP